MGGLLAPLLAITMVLIFWNYRRGRYVHQWSNDAKNLYIWIRIAEDDKPFQRDYLSGKVHIKAYMPLCRMLMNFFRGFFKSIEKSVIACHICLTTAFVYGWGLTFYVWTGSILSALLGFMLVIPLTHTIAGDTLSAGLPGNWTPRFFSNAALPWFLLLVTLSFNDPWLFPASGVLSSLIFHLHPVTGIITGVVLILSMGLCLKVELIQWTPALITLSLACAGPVLFQILYQSETRAHARLSKKQISEYNALGFARFDLWPYPNSVIGAHLGTNVQALIGCLMLPLAIFFFMDATLPASIEQPLSNTLASLSIFNMILCALLVMRMEPFGYVIVFFGSLGVAGHFHEWLLLPMLVIVMYQYRHRGSRPPAILALLSIAPLLMALANQQPFQPVTHLSLLFNLLAPGIYLVYLCSCLFHYRIVPFWLNRTIVNADFGRILKGILLTPIYFALIGLDRNIEKMDINLISYVSTLAAILTIAYCLRSYVKNYRGSNEDSEDMKVFRWIKENLSEEVLIHAVSNLPPLQDPDRPETSSFAFRLRAIAQRSITGCWKDGGILYYFSPFDFFDWWNRMNKIGEVLRKKDLSAIFRQAQEFGADVLLYPSSMNAPSEKLEGRTLATFSRYTIFELPKKEI